MFKVLLVLALCLAVVLSQNQVNLFPVTADGFETVHLDDMSFVNEISAQTWGPNFTNITFYVYGNSRIRTVYTGKQYYVGATPNENWYLPFIDFHTWWDGTDIWGVGPINALPGHYADNQGNNAYQFEIAVVTTKNEPWWNATYPRGRIFLRQPIGFDGTFYTTRVVGFDPHNILGYFCGFFPNYSNPQQLMFGVKRAHFDESFFDTPFDPNNATGWVYNHSIDHAVLNPYAQFTTFNTDLKPFLLHTRALPTDPVNTTNLIVVDPWGNTIYLVKGNVDPTIPLTYNNANSYVPTAHGWGRIVSAVELNGLILVGVSAPGNFTGWIDVLHATNLSAVTTVMLPTNYSDPRALVIDYFAPTPTCYIGLNGGWAVLKLDLTTFKFTGFQSLPFYLHRTWRGTATHEHVYFVTNEQHSKVYRMAKADFCSETCIENAYCQNAKCICSPSTEMRDGKCQWRQVIVEKTKVKKEKGGEVALGIFFALSFVAAAVGWYMVWKNKRGYQSVA